VPQRLFDSYVGSCERSLDEGNTG